jgi:hypothetical protein
MQEAIYSLIRIFSSEQKQAYDVLQDGQSLLKGAISLTSTTPLQPAFSLKLDPTPQRSFLVTDALSISASSFVGDISSNRRGGFPDGVLPLGNRLRDDWSSQDRSPGYF